MEHALWSALVSAQHRMTTAANAAEYDRAAGDAQRLAQQINTRRVQRGLKPCARARQLTIVNAEEVYDHTGHR